MLVILFKEKRKKQKQVIEKQKQVNPEAKDIIGQSVTIQTPVLQGTKGKVIGTRADQGRPNIAVVDVGNKTREIKLAIYLLVIKVNLLLIHKKN